MPIKRHGVVLLGPSVGGDPPFIGAKVQAGTHLLLGPSAGGEPPFIGVWQPL